MIVFFYYRNETTDSLAFSLDVIPPLGLDKSS